MYTIVSSGIKHDSVSRVNVVDDQSSMCYIRNIFALALYVESRKYATLSTRRVCVEYTSYLLSIDPILPVFYRSNSAFCV